MVICEPTVCTVEERVILGTTVNVTAGEEPELSLAVIVCAPRAADGIVKIVLGNEPFESVGAVVTVVLSKFMVTLVPVLKPLPLT